MAYVVFMQVDGYRSPDVGKTPEYRGWIIVESIMRDLFPLRSLSPSRQPLSAELMCISKRLDSSSSFLRQMAASGGFIKQLVFDVCEATKRGSTRWRVRTTFKGVVIQRLQVRQMVVAPGKAAEVIEDIYFTWESYSVQYR